MLKKYFIGTFAVAAFAFAISASAAYDFGTTTLKVGSKGEAVKTLQTLVGATPADGVFGKMTAAKVKVWQAANGLTADGYFGKASMAKANMVVVDGGSTGGTTGATCPNGMLLANNCAAATTGTPVVTGGAGDIVISPTSTDAEDNVNEGAKDTKVLGFKVQAEGSDVAITNVKVTLENATSSFRPTNFASEVSVWMGSTKVGSANLADFTKSGNVYSKSIALTGAAVKMGVNSKATFYVAVTALSSIDTTDMANDAWTMTATNFRFVDGTGVVMTETGTETATFDFQSQATSGDVKVVVSKGTTSPIAQNVIVSTTSSTKNLSLLDFKVKTTGSTASFDTLAATITLATATGALSELQLVDGSGAVLATLDASAYPNTSVVRTFTLDDTKVIAANTTESFKITATVNKGISGNFASGAAITAAFASFSPEDSNGDVITDTGSATGATQTFVYSVPTISVTGTPTLSLFAHTDGTTAGLEDSYKATIAFNVTAPENDAVYIPLDSFAYGTNGTAGVLFTKTGGATVTSTSVQYAGADNISSITDGASYRVDAGATQKFELSVYLTGNDVNGKISMTGLWYETAAGAPDGTPLVSALTTLYTPLVYLAK